LWSAWESILRQAMWGPIVLRRAVVVVARRVPSDWLRNSKGVLRTAITAFFNHLECPKSLRNGACGALTVEGTCGELLKYGIRKPCVFHYRNTRDFRGERLASRWTASAERLEASRFGIPIAFLMRLAAAVVARRNLSSRIYPRVDTHVPGASAIVSAMRGRFDGATIFGSRAPLPRLVARSQIAFAGISQRGERLLAAVRPAVLPLRRRMSERTETLAAILKALSQAEITQSLARDAPLAAGSTYERVLAHEIESEPHRSVTAAGQRRRV
jgi:hypothetical protein